MVLALQGIRVLDFSDSVAGPFTTKFLASCGAEVIRVESRNHLGFRRNGPWGPAGSGPIPQVPENQIDFSTFDNGLLVGPTYVEMNHDKLSITLNLSQPEGRKIFARLVAISDVVVENFSYGVMQKWGYDYDNLKRIKPDIIDVSIPSLGKGPYQHWSTWGMNLLSLSGFAHAWGHPDTPMEERMAGGIHGDYIAGAKAAACAIAALFYRAATGKGQHLEFSQAESTIAVQGPSYLDYFVNHRINQPQGNRHPQYAPYNAYPCKGEDRWCVIAIFNEEEWQKLRTAMSSPQWAEDPKFKDNASRRQNVAELDKNIAAWTRGYTPHQVMKMLQWHGIAAGAVQNCEDQYFDLQMRSTHFPIEQEVPRLGTIEISGVPMHLTVGQKTPNRFTSKLGEHNDYVFRQLLGMTPEEIKEMEKAKVIY